MPDPIIPDTPGLIPSALDWMGRLAQPGMNLLHGNLAGAGRQLVDLAGDVIDAPLPGDWIPHISHPEDFVEPHDLLGTDPVEHPILSKLEDTAGNMLLNPASYFGGAAIGAAGKAIPKGVALLPDAAQRGIAKAGRLTRQVFAAEDITPETARARAHAQAVGGMAGKAQGERVASIFDGSTEADQLALGQASHGVELGPDGRPAAVIPGSDASQRLEYLIAKDPTINADYVRKALGQIQALGDTQFTEGSGSGLGGGVFDPGAGKKEYFPRIFSGTKGKGVDDELGNYRPTGMSSEDFQKPEELAKYLTDHPDVNLEFNAAKAMARRADRSGGLAQKGDLGKTLEEQYGILASPAPADASQGFKATANPADNARINTIIDAIAAHSPEDGQVLKDAFNGLGERDGFTNFLSKANRLFKAPAVYGAIIPKLGTMVSNLMSGAEQQAATPGTRFNALTALKDTIPNAIGAIGDGIRSVDSPSGQFGKFASAVDESVGKLFGNKTATSDLQEVENAYKAGDGSIESMMNNLSSPTVASAVQHGVFGNGFVNAEKMIAQGGQTGWKKFASKWWDMPGVMFQGTEQRMRYGLYKALVEEKGIPDAEAARLVNESLYDYNSTSVPNRRARDIIPFFQFTAKAIPQQAKMIAKYPAIGVGLNELSKGSAGQPVYPYMNGHTNIPIGQNDQGDDEYITGLRLPYEALNWLPNLSDSPLEAGRQAEQQIVGSSQPLLKSAYSFISGHDPYFESKAGSYDKIPLLGDSLGTGVGRAYNVLSGAGVLQPLDSPLRQVAALTNPDRSNGIKALDLLTGANIADVNADQALEQELQARLSRDPDVNTYQSFYQQSKDPETQAMLHNLRDAKKNVKERKKHMAEEQARLQALIPPTIPGL